MPQFVTVDSAGGVSRRMTGIDLAPLLIREVPGTAFSKSGTTTGEGIAYRRDGTGNSRTVGRRYILSVWEGNEGSATQKFGIRETGGMEWRPGPSNPIYLLPVSDGFGGSTHGLKIGGSSESSASYDVANAGIDLHVPQLRLPLEGLDLPVFNSSWSWKNYNYGASVKPKLRVHERLMTIPSGSAQVEESVGFLIPTSSFVLALYSKVKDASSAGLTYSIGVPSATSRYGSGHDAATLGYDSLHVDAAAPWRYYGSGDVVRVTLSGTTTSQFQIGLLSILLYLPDVALSGTAPFDP